ncbi:respiratory nitrate reductase subunit gamma [Streptomyces luteolifulvus]|uniref:Nitrate reductase-like protein NarX n=1 Tax=Streptomyces luteolifulvus TaxID=2615112 RepID=A0A6H9UUH7_9ACTN|nr:respiratory nitrate reductase subunit gamma [Streptomyces luteolifulvus]KAB1143508.1 respiratory nitrate reductase subunit gamma [Streptomyces luteolifulvus]
MITLLWLAAPYVALTSFVLGHIWRYRHDQFGWTTRSSQLYESRLLRLGSPLFHFGLLAVIGGHAMGILIPASWTEFAGISEGTYHFVSVSAGTLSGLTTVAGLAILLYRRVTVPAVRKATTANDKVMYALLATAMATGMLNTVGSNLIGGGYDYRATVSPWFRSLFSLNPQPELMTGVPISFQVHNLAVLSLLAIWPYTRLVHVFSAPLGYLVRPYVVYRSRDPQGPDARRYARAWETPSAPPTRR